MSTDEQQLIPGTETPSEERSAPRRARRRRSKGTGGMGSSPLSNVVEAAPDGEGGCEEACDSDEQLPDAVVAAYDAAWEVCRPACPKYFRP